jgi:aminoglycoside/choline kinase family phosphotransferase
MHRFRAMTPAPTRADALCRFAETALAATGLPIEPASADASFRSYWRVTAPDRTFVVMDAPPGKEDLGPWLDIGARLHRAGLHTPEIHAVDRENGFVLMEDLGSQPYLAALGEHTVDALYADALDALHRMQTAVDTAGLPVFDETFVTTELEIMPEWFLRRHLGYAIECDEWDVVEVAFRALISAVRSQPQTFMHRDYHSRNLMVVRDRESGIGNREPAKHESDSESRAVPPLPLAGEGRGEGSRSKALHADRPHPPSAPSPASGGTERHASLMANPGIIDFQGAMIGPITYDLASLLRDCYIAWDAERVEGWVESYRERLRHAHLVDSHVDAARFRRWFDLAGLQRHIKVLGLFCRLNYRDGKAHYLDDLPLVWHYVIAVAGRYPELAPLADLLKRTLGDRDIRTARDEAAAG